MPNDFLNLNQGGLIKIYFIKLYKKTKTLTKKLPFIKNAN